MTSLYSHRLSTADGDQLVALVEKTIATHDMIVPGQAVLAAVSGGPDSVALLYVLMAIAEHHGYRIGVAHFHHGLRQESADGDARFVERLAKQHNLPYYIEKTDLIAEQKKTGQNLEEAGRQARYGFFQRIAARRGFDRIAVGHHGDDNAELIVMNLLRGSGPAGISGMDAKRNRIVRPLICASREEILSFLETRLIPYRHDPSNDETAFQRNHIRHHLMPALAQYNPRIVETLNRLGKVVGDEDQWIETVADSLLAQVLISRQPAEEVLDITGLTALHTAALRRVLRKAIGRVKGDLRRIEFFHIDAAIDLIRNNRQYRRLDLPDRVRIAKNGRRLTITKEKKSLRSLDLSGKKLNTTGFEYRIEKADAIDTTVCIGETGDRLFLRRMRRRALSGWPIGNTMVVDWDRLAFPLTIRNARPGDRFTPLGLNGTQKIKNFFINKKVPPARRRQTPLVVDANGITWVSGFRIDDRVKITAQTTTVLEVVYMPAADNNCHVYVEDPI